MQIQTKYRPMRYSKIIAGLALTACTSLASAGLVIDSINVQMVNTTFSARNLTGTDQERFAVASSAFEFSEGSVCSKNLTAFEDISYRGSCGGTRNDYAALYTITGSLSGGAEFQFGLDWGRGGFVLANSSGAPLDYINDDIWWGGNWNNSSEIISYSLQDVGDFSLTLLGFEGCCDGINSARYRSWDSTEASQRGPQSEWATLAVNAVPIPGSLPLVAMGALLLWRRRQS